MVIRTVPASSSLAISWVSRYRCTTATLPFLPFAAVGVADAWVLPLLTTSRKFCALPIETTVGSYGHPKTPCSVVFQPSALHAHASLGSPSDALNEHGELLSASKSTEQTNSASTPLWFALWRDGELAIEATRVFLSTESNIADLKRAVHERLKPMLDDVAPARLTIYEPQKVEEDALANFTNGEFGTKFTRMGSPIPRSSSTSDIKPILVVAPNKSLPDVGTGRELDVEEVQEIMDAIGPNCPEVELADYHPEQVVFDDNTWNRQSALDIADDYISSYRNSIPNNGMEQRAFAATYAAPGCGKTHFLGELARRYKDRAIFVSFNSNLLLLDKERSLGGIIPTVVRILHFGPGRHKQMTFRDFADKFYKKLGMNSISLETALCVFSQSSKSEVRKHPHDVILLLDEIRKLSNTALQELLDGCEALSDRSASNGFRLIVATLDWEPVWKVVESDRVIRWIPLEPLKDAEAWFLSRLPQNATEPRCIIQYYLAMSNWHARTMAESLQVLPDSEDGWATFQVEPTLKRFQNKAIAWATLPALDQTESVLRLLAASILSESVPLNEEFHGKSLSYYIKTGFAINGISDLNGRRAVPVFSPIYLKFWCEYMTEHSSPKYRLNPIWNALLDLFRWGDRNEGYSYEMFHARFQLLRRWAYRFAHPNKDSCPVAEWYGQNSKILTKSSSQNAVVQIPSLQHPPLLDFVHLKGMLPNYDDLMVPTIPGGVKRPYIEIQARGYVLVKTCKSQPGFDIYSHNGGSPILEEVMTISERDGATSTSTRTTVNKVAEKLEKCAKQGFHSSDIVWVLLDPKNNAGSELFLENLQQRQEYKAFNGTVVVVLGKEALEWYGPTFSSLAEFWVKADDDQ